MVTLADALARTTGDWDVFVTIEGVGGYYTAGQVSAAGVSAAAFCYRSPDASNPIYRPHITAQVDLLPEIVPLFGGFPELGAVTVNLLDVDNALTTWCATDRLPNNRLAAGMNASVGFATPGFLGPAVGDVLYIDREAMFVDAVDMSGVCTVRRGALETEATSHQSGAAIYLSSPFLRTRRLRVWLAPQDATAPWTANALFWDYTIDAYGWDPSLNTWQIEGRSFLRYLQRLLPRKPRTAVIKDPGELTVTSAEGSEGPIELWDERRFHLHNRKTGEIFAMGGAFTAAGANTPVRRALAGTSREDFKEGQELRQVLLGDWDFRYSPGPTPSTSRASGTWVRTEHPVDMLLMILLSSAGEDGLELTNYASGGNNYSSLPAGYGAGVPASLIDFESFEDVRNRMSMMRFPNFVLGAEKKATGVDAIITEHFLRPLGLYLTLRQGKIFLRLPRLPAVGETTTPITADNILAGQDNLPMWAVAKDMVNMPGAVTVFAGPKQIPVSFTTSEFLAINLTRTGWYEDADRPDEISVAGLSDGDTVTAGVLAMRRLVRLASPMTRLNLTGNFGLADLSPGRLVAVTAAELPDLATGTRGWAAKVCEVASVEPVLSPETGATTHLALYAYATPDPTRLVAPAAVQQEDPVDDFTREFRTKVFSPDRDVSYFFVGQEVSFWLQNGTTHLGDATITAINAPDNEITFDLVPVPAQDVYVIVTPARFNEGDAASLATYAYPSDSVDDATAQAVYGEK